MTIRTSLQHVLNIYENHYHNELDEITKPSQEWHVLELLKKVEMAQYIVDQSNDENLAKELMRYINYEIDKAKTEAYIQAQRGNRGTAWHHNKVVDIFGQLAQRVEHVIQGGQE